MQSHSINQDFEGRKKEKRETDGEHAREGPSHRMMGRTCPIRQSKRKDVAVTLATVSICPSSLKRIEQGRSIFFYIKKGGPSRSLAQSQWEYHGHSYLDWELGNYARWVSW